MEFLRRTDGRTDGRTDWQAGGLPLFTLESTGRRLCVATLQICRQPDTSNSLRIFCLSHILSFIISFFSIFRPSLVALTLFLASFPRVSGQLLEYTSVYAMSQPKASKKSHFCRSEVRIDCVSFAAAQDWVRMCMCDHLVQHIEFLSSIIYGVTSSVSDHSFSAM
jgi:hypothetical protein